MKNEFRNYFFSKSRNDEAVYKPIIMHECQWDAHKWGNKLSGKSLLTDLEKQKIAEVEKMMRICNELDWRITQYHDRTKVGATLLSHEIEVINKYADFGPKDVFCPEPVAKTIGHRQGVEI